MAEKATKYVEGIGRRKTSSARVRLSEAKSQSITVNDTPFETYFKTATLQKSITNVFETAGSEQQFAVSIKVQGGGVSSQAGAVRLGIARALVERDHAMRGTMKKAGYLKRDPRAKERRKFGLKKARKSAQWSKR